MTTVLVSDPFFIYPELVYTRKLVKCLNAGSSHSRGRTYPKNLAKMFKSSCGIRKLLTCFPM